ncbi:DUF4328 domain-containing protein [Actinophytocola sp.]|uniref:DUF4328 domain-containing protein n=1 Tax=Actinophytocola sp. TaxID=1872138 RepID=UPI002ED4DDDE
MHGPQQIARPVSYRRAGEVGLAAIVLVGVVAVLGVVSTWATWNAYWVVADYVAGGAGVTDADVAAADDLVSTTAAVYLLALVAAGVVFIVWLWRVRLNAEILCRAPHRLGRGWATGSWICPVVNLWFPFMIVDDVYRASRPTNVPDLFDLRSVPWSRWLGLWWALWLGGLALDWIDFYVWHYVEGVESLRTAGIVEAIESVLTVGAAVALAMIVRQIGGWQDGRIARTA